MGRERQRGRERERERVTTKQRYSDRQVEGIEKDDEKDKG